MVKVTNPIDKDLTLQFKGETYTLEAGVSEKFTPEVAAQWFTIYGFLSVEGTSDKEVDKVVEELTKEEEAPVEEKPKKKAAKKTTKKADKEDKE